MATMTHPQASQLIKSIDAVLNLGGEIEETGRTIGRLAAIFPVSLEMIVEELEYMKRLCERAIDSLPPSGNPNPPAGER